MYNTVFKKLLDIGDIIGVEGNLFTTKVGEKTVLVKNFKLELLYPVSSKNSRFAHSNDVSLLFFRMLFILSL